MAAYPKHLKDTPLDELPAGSLVRLPTILAALPISRSTFLAWVQAGRAPQPVRIGPRAVAWKVEEIREFLAGCQVASRTTLDPNAVKAQQAAMRKRAERRAEAEKAARRALLI